MKIRNSLAKKQLHDGRANVLPLPLGQANEESNTPPHLKAVHAVSTENQIDKDTALLFRARTGRFGAFKWILELPVKYAKDPNYSTGWQCSMTSCGKVRMTFPNRVSAMNYANRFDIRFQMADQVL